MKKSRFSVEQIVVILKQAEQGMPVAELRLPVRHRHFDLAQQLHHLLRTMLLPSFRTQLLLYQCFSSSLAQEEPGTPKRTVFRKRLADHRS